MLTVAHVFETRAEALHAIRALDGPTLPCLDISLAEAALDGVVPMRDSVPASLISLNA
ncbi:MAG: hypothetical protein JWR10_4239 [Rubritepida sp.]|nr:hypothetical protein [Rubritepida sp.]